MVCGQVLAPRLPRDQTKLVRSAYTRCCRSCLVSVYAMSVWPRIPHAESWRNDPVKLVLPIAMWLSSLNRRVLAAETAWQSNIFANLADKCTIFAAEPNSFFSRGRRSAVRSNRIVNMENAFVAWRESIYGMRPRSKQLRQKNILLKEVQPPGLRTIFSCLVDHEHARSVRLPRPIQSACCTPSKDRILSLATVHKSCIQNE